MNVKTLRKFIEIASERLTGEWMVIGGTVLPALGIEHRATVDIDFINVRLKETNADALMLMEIAEQLGLPVESINQAGAYFFSKVDDASRHLVVLKKGKKCTIYRPDVWLFVKLKLGRFTETDLQDCMAMIQNFPEEFEVAKENLMAVIQEKISSTELGQDGLRKRLLELLKRCQN